MTGRLFTIASTLSLVLSGCGTIESLRSNEPFPNVVYGGTYLSLHGHVTQFDAPFSLVADTVVLPYTIPRTIHNRHHPEDQPPPP